MNTIYVKIVCFSLVATGFGFCDVKEEIGFNALVDWSGGSLASTSTVNAGVVEASSSSSATIYTPTLGSSETTGKTVTEMGATPSAGDSPHANTVSANYFGNVTSIAPDITDVDIWFAGDFLNAFLTNTVLPDGSRAVGSSDVDVMNHSYVSNPSDSQSSLEFVERFDFFTLDSDVLNVVGLNNGSSTTVPAIWAECYNGISVGVTSGGHSSGDTLTAELGAGRQKPEIVAPHNVTSWATATVSSAGSLLIAKSKEMGLAKESQPLIIKSILMAGATKEEFDWNNTSSRPLDDTFGAGEVNILNSYRILSASDKSDPTPAGEVPGTVALRGWANQSVNSSSTQIYEITVPAYAAEASICANLSWQRQVTSSIEFDLSTFSQIYTYDFEDLSDLSLQLKDSANQVLASSDSSIDNNEHIWQVNLPPGVYTLEVSSAEATGTNYCLAWRTDVTPSNTVLNNGFQVNYSEMIPSHSYTLQSSTPLHSWADVLDFTSSATGEFTYTDSSPSSECFFRLKYFTP